MGIFSKAKESDPNTVPVQPLNYLMLDDKDFRCLVRGGVIHFGNLRIALKDIGWEEMSRGIALAVAGHEIYKDHIKEK